VSTFDPRLDLSLDEFLSLPRETKHFTPKAVAYGPTWRDVLEARREDRRRFPRVPNRRRARSLVGVGLFYADPCAYCGGSGEVMDHIVPLKRGGRNRLDNLTRACRACNGHKGVRSLLMFLAQRAAA